MKKIRPILHLLILVILMKFIVSIFVKEVKYPELSSKKVNSDYCGLTSIPIYIHYSKDCFHNSYHNSTVSLINNKQKPRSIEPRIVNGEVADPSEAPWAVSIKKIRNKFHYARHNLLIPQSDGTEEVSRDACGGSLITLEWVTTAAHCLPTKSSHWIRVSAGLIPGSAWEGRQTREVRLNNFFRNDEFDIALVKLSQPFIETKHDRQYLINTICLPQKTEYSNEEEEIAELFGLGRTGPSGGLSKRLMKGTFIIKPHKVCEDIHRNRGFGKYSYDWNKRLCSSTTFKGAAQPCSGDSGSGLIQYHNLYSNRAILFGVYQGIVFSGKDICDGINKYPFFAAVSVHIDWILNIIRNN